MAGPSILGVQNEHTPETFVSIPKSSHNKRHEKIEIWQRSLTKFIWRDKKPRVKLKIMCEIKEKGGLQIPNLKLYYDAVCLAWLKDWWTLTNKKLLNIEGFNLKFGWHAYLCYNKHKMDELFTYHYVRQALLSVGLKYKRYLPEQIPPWVIPCKVFKTVTSVQGRGWLKYS